MMKNPKQFMYADGQKVETDGRYLYDQMQRYEKLLSEEIVELIPMKYTYVNVETGKVVKNASQKSIEEGKVKKIIDNEKILDSAPDLYLTPKGQEYLGLRNYLAALHQENIEKGIAKDIREMVSNPETKENIEEPKDNIEDNQ